MLALLAVVACMLIWWMNRIPTAHDEALASKQGSAAAASEPQSEKLALPASRARSALDASVATATPKKDRAASPAANSAFSLWCKLVDGETQRSIGGQNLRATHGDLVLEATSDIAGFFQLTDSRLEAVIPRGDSAAPAPALRIDSLGFGPVLLILEGAHERAEQAVTLVLWRSAALEARVVDASGAAIVGATVSVSCAAHALARPEGAYIYAPDISWSAETGAKGTSTIEGLAADAPLALTVQRGGEQLFKSSVPLTLKPGERREWTCRVGGGARVFGALLDQDGTAVANQEIWLANQAAGLPDALCYFDIGQGFVQRATTDLSGRFEFANVPEGAWWVGPGPLSASAAMDETAVSSVARNFAIVAGELEKEVDLRVQRGLYIQGRVVLPGGNRAPQVQVLALSEDPAGYLQRESAMDGSFKLGPLLPGGFRLMAQAPVGFADSPYVVARAGDQGVVITLSMACRIRVRAVDESSAESAIASFWVRAREPLKWGRGAEPMDRSSAAAGLEVSGMPAGIYDISARTEDGRVGLLHAVEVRGGAQPQEFSVRVAPGARLRLRLEGRAQSLPFLVLSDGMMMAMDGLQPGASRLVFVPAGTAIVQLKFRETVLEEREVTAVLGEEVEVLFHRD